MRLRDIVVTSGGIVFQQICQFLVGIYVAQRLGAIDYGSLSVARNIINLLLTIAPLGLDLALLKFLSQNGQSEREHITNLRPFLRLVFLVNAIIAAILICAALPLQVHIFKLENFAACFGITALSLPALALIATYGAYYRAVDKTTEYAVGASYIQASLRSGLSFLAVLFGLGSGGVAGASTLAAVAALGFLWFKVGKCVDRWSAENRGIKFALPVLKESRWMAASLFVAGLTRSADVIVLGLFSTAPVVGSYSALSMISYLVAVYPSALSQTMGPQVAKYYKEGRMDEVNRIQTEYIEKASVIGGFLFGGIAAFGPRLSLLIGPSFHITPELALLIPLSFLVSATLSPMGYALSMTGFHKQELYVMAAGGISTVALLFILVPQLAGVGAALSVVIAFSAASIFRFVLVGKRTGRKPGRVSDILPPIVALGFAYMAKELSDFAFGMGLFGSILGSGIYIIMFALFVWFRVLTPSLQRKVISCVWKGGGKL